MSPFNGGYMNIAQVKGYTDKLGLSFSAEDCVQVIELAKVYGVTDYKMAVWDYLDEFEGIAHSRDPEYWSRYE